ncbi:ribonuclease H-like domain-containing protein [Cercophora samala]|uniref:Ribonuclease H-like domain-containing protein n=1 Tax=Cercophora samala TaxID=330535 RepID=A0AA39Z5V2_9PEZI|nr:ribonuclease H-like domain-containing protein [Cercophora samala]
MIPGVTIIDTPELLSELLGTLINLPVRPPSLYLDLEGQDLSRRGTISIIQIHVSPLRHTYLTDVHTLKEKVFSTTGKSDDENITLKTILEDATIPKVFFDVRNDSDALYHLYGVSLAGVHDIQLMKFALAPFKRLMGLAYCMELDACSSEEEVKAVKATKETGRKLFSPACGGSYDVFNQRPIPDRIVEYCAQNAHILPVLWKEYDERLGRLCDGEKKRDLITKEAVERVRVSQTVEYGKWDRREMIKGPRGVEWKVKYVHDGCCDSGMVLRSR